MREKVLLNIVLHQGGGYRLGVMTDQYVDSPVAFVCIKNLIPGKELNLDVTSCLYSFGSIYSPEISEWIQQNGFAREGGDDIPLLKFYYERVDNVDVYEYVGPSSYKKVPRVRILRDDKGQEYPYEDANLLSLVWPESSEIKEDSKEFTKFEKWLLGIAAFVLVLMWSLWGFWAGILCGLMTLGVGECMKEIKTEKKKLTDDPNTYAAVIVGLILIFSPFVACNPATIAKDTYYSHSGWDYVTYFYIDDDSDITFGGKHLGNIGTYRLKGKYFYDDSGKAAGELKRGPFNVKVQFYSKYLEQFNGSYQKDH